MEMNLYEAIKDRKKYLSERKAKTWIYQTLKALDFMHRNGIFHRGRNACITTRVSAMMRTDETDLNTEKLIKDRKTKIANST